jgi:carbonic anhydrase
MRLLRELFENNRRWADARRAEDPKFFERLSAGQSPELFWIGCSDSRVPAEEIVGLEPGSLFVHRNVANLVVHTDFNVLSALQFAVENLHVRHVIVCGHYRCGGVQAALESQPHGLVDNWLRNIKDVAHAHESELQALGDAQRVDRMCELNVIEQVAHVCQTTIVQSAWARGQSLAVHGWIYDHANGRLHDLGVCITAADQIPDIYRVAAGPRRG